MIFITALVLIYSFYVIKYTHTYLPVGFTLQGHTSVPNASPLAPPTPPPLGEMGMPRKSPRKLSASPPPPKNNTHDTRETRTGNN